MAAPLILVVHIDVPSNRLVVSVSRNVTDELTGATTAEMREVAGKLSDMTGLGALRTNLIAWVKAQTGFAGTVTISP
jgi:hypothetical protein